MKKIYAGLLLFILLLASDAISAAPEIVKLGTIDIDLVETTPIVFKERLYRFEYVRHNYWNNSSGKSFFRFIDHETGEATPSFAVGYHFGSAAVDGDLVIVTGTKAVDGEEVDLFVSRDLEHWDSWNALTLPGYGLFNTSLCKTPEGYTLMFEVGKPEEVAGVRFTARFATSPDLKVWTLTAPECTFDKSRYTAPHCLRWHEGWYYNFYLEEISGSYEQYVVRSRDLIHWDPSPMNPVLKADDSDRTIANQALTAEQRKRIAEAVNLNNSDFDYCEFEGHLVINYSWGNQRGTEFLAEARYEGSESAFLHALFPSAGN